MTRFYLWFGTPAVWINIVLLATYCDEYKAESLVIGSNYSIAHNIPRRIFRRASATCDGFQCNTTLECINPEIVCDGHEDCKDGSDEFQALCKARRCPGYLFRCDYGACIDANKKCNGIEDCKDASDEKNCPISTIPRVETNCRSDEFECKNGQCISIDYKCDGSYHCDDKSDESRELCLNSYCPGYLFRCAYGACVNGNMKCNGVKDCLDGSDEVDCKSGPILPPVVIKPDGPGPPPEGGCKTPPQPSYGKWTFFGGGRAPETGIFVKGSTIIEFSCEKGYQLVAKGVTNRKDTEFVFCQGTEWSIEVMPVCHRRCRPLHNTATTQLTCTDQSTKAVIPCDRATNDTRLEYSCSPYYERPAGDSAYRYCDDGQWDRSSPACVQVCGEKRVSLYPLIVNGKEVKRGDYPWVAAIYQRQPDGTYINVCGGSMLNGKVVLTAAHCVSDHNGTPLDATAYIVSVGKYYNKYKDERDTEAQYEEVDHFEVYDIFRGYTNNFLGDIALIILKKPFALSKVAQPVCINGIDDFPLTPGTKGIVTGWGYTQAGGSPSDDLKELELPYRNENDCIRELPTDFGNLFVQSDKLCAGFFQQSTSVCKGDSGGGLVFPDVHNRFHLIGVVSLAHKLDETRCNIQQSALFTKVARYLEWVRRLSSRYSDDARSQS